MAKWKDALNELKKEAAKAPPGCQSLEEIAADMDLQPETARRVIVQLVKCGRAERVAGKSLSATGQLITCNYYRLVGKAK